MLSSDAVAAQERVGSFYLYVEADPVDGRNRSRLVVEGTMDSDISVPYFVWECDGDHLTAYVDAGRFLDSSPIETVAQFDEEASSDPAEWPPSEDGRAAFVPDEELGRFTGAAQDSGELFVWLLDYRRTEHSLRFPLEGLAEGLEGLSCASIH